MTRVPRIYGCRSCNLVFHQGISNGPATHPKSYHLSVCNNCGLIYKMERTHYTISHPLRGLFYGVPNYLSTNPKRKEIDAIQAHVHENTKVGDVAKILKSLPIRKEWLSGFEYSYKKVTKKLKVDISRMTIVELLQVCADYEHTILQRFAATEVLELNDGVKYWIKRDSGMSSRKEPLHPPYPKFKMQLQNELVYYHSKHDEYREIISAYQQFRDVICVNCQSKDSIGYPNRNQSTNIICPRCSRPQIEKIGGM